MKIPLELIESQKLLLAKKKLPLVLLSKSVQEIPVNIGDMVQVYVKNGKWKQEKWSEPKQAINFDNHYKNFTVPASSGRSIRSALEDV